MTGRIFDTDSLDLFRDCYPQQEVRLGHRLAGRDLLTLPALAGLAERMRPENVEYNRGDLPIGVDPAAVPGNGLSIADTIRSIEQCGSWMVLKFVEQDPSYRALLDEVLPEVAPAVRGITGEMLKTEGFIFISSPGAITPFHFDPEHNILLQIAGEKRIHIFPAGDEALADSRLHEAYHQGGHRNLPWRDEHAAKGRSVDLGPGDAVYVPVKAPHWVRNGSSISISLSVTWRSLWSYYEADVRGLNQLLRRAGLDPAPPRPFPHRNFGKSLAYRAIRKARQVLGG